MERRYTLAEIDAMREAVRRRIPQPMRSWSGPIGVPAEETAESVARWRAWEARCEDQLRTALLAGLGPEDFPADEAKTG